MITALLIIIAVLIVALWISVMALWWRHEQGHTEALEREDVIKQWDKATRLMRRSWYTTLRYSKQVTLWGNKKISNAFVAIFPRSRPAFTDQDILTGLEHGPSSYFLASLSGKKKKVVRKKTIESDTVLQSPEHLSE